MLIIDKGKKVIEGASTQLFDPSQTVVELQTLDNNFALLQIQNSKWKQHIQQQRDNLIMLKLDRQEIPQLHKDLVEMNVQLVSLQPRHSLEDYFLQSDD